MNKLPFHRMRVGFTTLVALGVLSLLVWRHFHGGVPVHHVLRRGDLPGISCWWDGILVPALSWFLSGRTGRRLRGDGAQTQRALKGVVLALVAAFLFGLALAWGTLHQAPATASVPSVLLLLALFFPIYRAECVLGFVLGMTPGVGSVLPLVFAVVMASAGWVVHRGLVPALLRGARWLLSTGR